MTGDLTERALDRALRSVLRVVGTEDHDPLRGRYPLDVLCLGGYEDAHSALHTCWIRVKTESGKPLNHTGPCRCACGAIWRREVRS